MQIKDYLEIGSSVFTLLGMLFIIYKTFRDPDIKAATDIELMRQACTLKHKTIDENISSIKDNHLFHIENDIKELKENQIKIFTILEERLPNKKL